MKSLFFTLLLLCTACFSYANANSSEAGSGTMRGGTPYVPVTPHKPPAGEWKDSEIKDYTAKNFAIYYPRKWEINTKINTYNPQTNITLETTGESYVQIELIPRTDNRSEQELLDDILFSYTGGQLIQVFSKAPANQWGEHSGTGVHMRGKILGYFPGGVRIFTKNHGNLSLLVTELYYSEDLKEVMPGYDLVAQSYQFKE